MNIVLIWVSGVILWFLIILVILRFFSINDVD